MTRTRPRTPTGRFTATPEVVQGEVIQPDHRTSEERIEDLTFQNLIRRWTALREWGWVEAANVMYGHVLEERERKART